MPVKGLSGSEYEVRAGAQALSLLSSPRNCLILRALADGPKRQVELRRETGFPAQTTLRAHLKRLEEIGVVGKHVGRPFPALLEHELASAGQELLFVLDTLERWLVAAPDGPFELGSDAAKVATKALVESWSSTVLHNLAPWPRSLTELEVLIPDQNYPSIERRLGSMRLAGQIEAVPADTRGTPYEVTSWMRSGVAPLVASARWEQRYFGAKAPRVTGPDVEAAFRLSTPLVRLPDGLSGRCVMEVELVGGRKKSPAGVVVSVTDRRIASCDSPTPADCAARAFGPTTAWFGAVIANDPTDIEVRGERRLALALLAGLHEALFPAGSEART